MAESQARPCGTAGCEVRFVDAAERLELVDRTGDLLAVPVESAGSLGDALAAGLELEVVVLDAGLDACAVRARTSRRTHSAARDRGGRECTSASPFGSDSCPEETCEPSDALCRFISGALVRLMACS